MHWVSISKQGRICEGSGHTAEEQTSQGCIEVCGAKIEAGNDETEERRNEIYMIPSDLRRVALLRRAR